MKRLGLVVGVLVVALVGSLLVRVAIADNRGLRSWSSTGRTATRCARGCSPRWPSEFNDADHETASGQPIEIRLVSCDSSEQIADLGRASKGAAPTRSARTSRTSPPTIRRSSRPQSDDWLVDLNHRAGRDGRRPREHRGASPRPGWASSPTAPWPSASAGRRRRSATPTSWTLLRTRRAGSAYPDCASGRRMGDRAAARVHQPEHVHERPQRARVAVLDGRRRKAPADLTVADVEDPRSWLRCRGSSSSWTTTCRARSR